MNAVYGLFAGLSALLLVVAGFAVVTRRHFAAVVGFTAFGLLLSLAWVALAAPDVALTEAAVGGGVTGVLLLSASVQMRAKMEVLPSWGVRFIAAVLAAIVTAGLMLVVLMLPDEAPTLAPAAKESLAFTGMGNPATAVLMAYRALDTMLEKVVLLLALVAVWSLGRDHFWGGRPDFDFSTQTSGPLLLLARVLVPVGVLVGIYLFWVGADEPGGAFAGGALIAAMGLLAFFAGVARPPLVGSGWLRWAVVVGIAVFLIVGFGGFWWAGDFLAYPDGLAKPVIVVIEVAMTLSIALTLVLLVVGPPGRRP